MIPSAPSKLSAIVVDLDGKVVEVVVLVDVVLEVLVEVLVEVLLEVLLPMVVGVGPAVVAGLRESWMPTDEAGAKRELTPIRAARLPSSDAV